jgi:hypothetical protein
MMIRIVLLVALATCSIVANAQDKKSSNDKKSEPQIHLESYQLSPLKADAIPSKDFQKAWYNAGKDLGYPKISAVEKEGDPLGNVKFQYFDDSWLTSDWEKWISFDNKLKFYIVGIYTKLKNEEKNKLSPEDFKSYTMGYYQCVNTLANFQQTVRSHGLNIDGNVEGMFQSCGMGRIF